MPATDRLIAVGRVLIGTALLAAPRRAGRPWLGDAADQPATQAALRAVGARDLGLGLGALVAVRRGRSARGWVEAGILADAADALATLAAWRHLPRSGRTLTVAMATVAAAIGAYASARTPAPSADLRRRSITARRPPDDPGHGRWPRPR